MPLRDIATSDSILLREIPGADDEKAIRSIRRLQEIGVGIVAPVDALAANPVANAIALVPAKDAGSVTMPEGAARIAITFDGSETSEQIAAALKAEPVMVRGPPDLLPFTPPPLTHLLFCQFLLERLNTARLFFIIYRSWALSLSLSLSRTNDY